MSKFLQYQGYLVAPSSDLGKLLLAGDKKGAAKSLEETEGRERQLLARINAQEQAQAARRCCLGCGTLFGAKHKDDCTVGQEVKRRLCHNCSQPVNNTTFCQINSRFWCHRDECFALGSAEVNRTTAERQTDPRGT